MKTPSSSQRNRGDFTSHFGLFLFFVVFPAAFTALAPRSTVHLYRDTAGVMVTVCAHTLYFIPYWCRQETRVTRVDLEFSRGERVGYNAHLSAHANQVQRRGRTEDNAVIQFIGDAGSDSASAMIEIGRMDAVLAQAQGFIDDPNSSSLALSFMAHRVLSLYIGLPLSLLVLLYLPLLGLAIVRRVLGRPYWPFDITRA
jgi:hypothetical protein